MDEKNKKVVIVESGMSADQLTEAVGDGDGVALITPDAARADWLHNVGGTIAKARAAFTSALTQAVDKLPSLEIVNDRFEAMAQQLVEATKNQQNPTPGEKYLLTGEEADEPVYVDGPHYTNRAMRRANEKRRARKWKRAGKEAAFVEQYAANFMTEDRDEARKVAAAALTEWTNNLPPLQRLAYLNGEKMRGRGFTR